MDNQFTQRVSEILLFSKEESDRLGNNYVGTGHLLLGIIREGDNKAVSILQSLYVDLKKLKLILEDELRGQNCLSGEGKLFRKRQGSGQESLQGDEAEHSGSEIAEEPGSGY